MTLMHALTIIRRGDAKHWTLVRLFRGQPRLLRPGGQRPRRPAAEQRDEIAALHSITSSARASNVGGRSRPSALAVLRLISSWYFVGAWTGRLAGFSPRRIGSTYWAAERNWLSRS